MARAPAPFSIVWPALALALLAGCSHRPSSPTAPPAAVRVARPAAAELAAAIAVQEAWSDLLLAHPDVVGTGVGLDRDGRTDVQVFLRGARGNGLPRTLGGRAIAYVATGGFEPFSLVDRTRPVWIGVSLGSASECIPGTVGAIVERGGRSYLLGPNHLLARRNAAATGEAIVQPSRVDAGADCPPSAPSERVARLVETEPLRFDGTDNQWDAALAELTTAAVCATPAGFYGAPSSRPAAAFPGLVVRKLGRTTGLTGGEIKSVNVKLNLTYPEGKARLVGQLLTSKGFGAFGDSGALVVTGDDPAQPVGMLIGGGSNGVAVVTPIGPLLARFGVSLCGR